MKSRSVGAKLFHDDGRTDGQADMTKLAVTCHNFVNMAAKGAVRINSMKAYKEEVDIHAFITSVLDGDEWSTSCSGHYTSVGRAPGTPRKELMDHTAGLDVSEKRIISCRYKCTSAKLTTSKIPCPTDIILSEEEQSQLVGRITRKQRFGYGPTIKYLCNILFQLCNSNIKHQFRGGKPGRR